MYYYMIKNNKFIIQPEKEITKCAPSKTFSENSCFTLESLQKLAEAYNNENGAKQIKITNSKSKLINDLSNRIVECGSDQLCWLDVEWVKNIKDYEIHKNTFRPQGPQGRFKWLSTTNINDIVFQYEDKYSEFKFLGAVPYDFENLEQLGISDINFDELLLLNKYKIGMVINLDEHWKKGSHWVGLYANLKTSEIYYFDSYGYKPKNYICNFVKKIALWSYNKYYRNTQEGGSDETSDTESQFMKSTKNKYEKIMNIDYNKNRHQFKSSECGVYSVNFILRLLKGESFNNICNNITPDDKVNKCRDVYFRFN